MSSGMVKSNDSPNWVTKPVFTTGEAARICRLSQQTIIRYFDNGRLKGFRVPGSSDRRILRSDLFQLMRRRRIPTSIADGHTQRVLVIDNDKAFIRSPRTIVDGETRFDVRTVSTGFDARLLSARFRPHLVLLDFQMPGLDGRQVCRRLHANPRLQETKIIIVSDVDSSEKIRELATIGADDFLRKPVDALTLHDRMETILRV